MAMNCSSFFMIRRPPRGTREALQPVAANGPGVTLHLYT